MQNEIEAKYFPIDVLDITKKLKNIDAKLKQERILMKRVVFDRSKNPSLKCTYARVRDEGDKITMSLKVNATSDGDILDQKELQISINSFKGGVDILEGAGLLRTSYQENFRTTWLVRNSEVVIDEWPALEPYIEIESPSIEELKEVSKLLNLEFSSRLIVSTDELYAKTYRISKEKALALISNITYSDIPQEFRNTRVF